MSELEAEESDPAILVEELDPVEVSLEGPASVPPGLTKDPAPITVEAEPVAVEAEPVAVEAEPVTVSSAAPEPPASAVVLASAPLAEVPVDAIEDAGPPTVTFEETLTAPVPLESTALPPAPDDPFTVLVCTLADVAIGAGSPHVASLLPGLFFDGRIDGPLDPAVAKVLVDGGLIEAPDATVVGAAFSARAAAWKAILRGTSDDFTACGAAMLDEWGAEVLAKLLDTPGRAPSLRQELRSRGVAAFGLVEAAA